MFEVDVGAFYSAFPPDTIPDVQRAMGQLVERYDIRRKTVLSIGSGTAFEEYWLCKLGENTLTIVDIDEGGGIEPVLARLPTQVHGLRYYVGDANEFLADSAASSGRFDVVYFSGFTPDEFHRDGLLRDRSEEVLRRKAATGIPAHQWAPWQDPFSPFVTKACSLLGTGGLLIVQSYTAGVDAVYHEHFLPAARRQLSASGLDLVEVHRFASTTGVNLFVARKAGGPPLPLATPITRFHGRAQAEPVERIWPTPAGSAAVA